MAPHPLAENRQHPLGIVAVFEADDKSSRPGESHPQALTETDVHLSAHPALIVQSQGEFQVAIAQTVPALAGQRAPASAPPCADGGAVA